MDGASSEDKSMSPLAAVINEANDLDRDLLNAVERLEKRLDPFKRPPVPTVSASDNNQINAEKQSLGQSLFTNSVSASNSKRRHCVDRIHNLLDSLDI